MLSAHAGPHLVLDTVNFMESSVDGLPPLITDGIMVMSHTLSCNRARELDLLSRLLVAWKWPGKFPTGNSNSKRLSRNYLHPGKGLKVNQRCSTTFGD